MHVAAEALLADLLQRPAAEGRAGQLKKPRGVIAIRNPKGGSAEEARPDKDRRNSDGKGRLKHSDGKGRLKDSDGEGRLKDPDGEGRAVDRLASESGSARRPSL